MSDSQTEGGPIDSFSPYSLYDVLENDFDPLEDDFHFDYHGFHIVPQGSGRYIVQYDGHVGRVMSFHRDDYSDVLELVADLNELVHRAFHYDYQDDKEELVEWAGKIMTRNENRAEENPELFVHMPDDPPEIDHE